MGKLIISPGGSGGGVSSDELTATLDNVLEGTTVVTSDTDDEIGTGTMPNNSGWSSSVGRNDSITIPKGYHDGTGTVAGPTMTDVPGKTITPNTTTQTAISEGQYATGDITVVGSSNLTAANIKHGVKIFDATGTYTGEGNAAAGDVRAGKTFSNASGAAITGTLATYSGTTTVTPTTSTQTLQTAGKIVGANITINPYTIVWG